MRLTTIVVCSAVLAGFVPSPQMAYAQAKEAEKQQAKDLAKAKQPVGGDLTEYRNRIADAYSRAVDAKKTLVSTTGNIADKEFRRVNSLIDSYNRNAGSFNDAAAKAGAALLPAMSPVTPGDLSGTLVRDDDAAPQGKYVVWVFKNEGGQWVRQADRTLATDNAGSTSTS